MLSTPFGKHTKAGHRKHSTTSFFLVLIESADKNEKMHFLPDYLKTFVRLLYRKRDKICSNNRKVATTITVRCYERFDFRTLNDISSLIIGSNRIEF